MSDELIADIPPASADERDARAWLALARRGHLAEAWQVSDRILARHRAAPDFTKPRHLQSIWTGGTLDGKRVLVRCYHGLGDSIQFLRYVPMVQSIAREVILWVQPSLIPLLATVPGIDRLLPLHDGVPQVQYDVDVEIMELPFVFRSTLDTIPRHVPYLHVDPAQLPGRPPRVGLVWRAGDWDPERSIPFDHLRLLLDLEGITWFGFQQHLRQDETHPSLVDATSWALREDARRIAALDLLITIDSMPAHLAGALGVPVWTLLGGDPDWRWMQDREDSPWYRTMRLFRQRGNEGWPGVLARVRDEVRALEYDPAHPCRCDGG